MRDRRREPSGDAAMVAARSPGHPETAAQGSLGGRRLARPGPLGRERGWGAHPQCGVRAPEVVVLEPIPDHGLGLGQAGELLDVEQLVAHA